tara:strand:- start:786 stop:902 length:117 start_codon:yes stop_codon:yes gene_type:complete
MKKFLGILVLGLPICDPGFSESVWKKYQNNFIFDIFLL